MNKEKIKNNRFVRHVYYRLHSLTHKKELVARAEATLQAFQKTFSSDAEKAERVRDMLRTYSHHGFGFDEYLCYHFEEKSKKEKLSFVADWEHLGYACSLNNPQNDLFFDDKFRTYEKFKKYYGRALAFFEREDQFAEFEQFVNARKSFVLKPLNLSCGKGVKVIHTKDFTCSQEIFGELLTTNKGGFLLEDFIVQHEAMARLHPASVNTVRVPTVRLDDEVLIINPFLRVGQGGNHVDNAGAGGIICTADAETGVTFAAADEHGARFSVHPNTNESLIGFQIPHWDQAKALVKELATVLPDNRYTGWDLALTENGWILVEANRRGQFVWQIASQKGFREEINSLLKKLGKKY